MKILYKTIYREKSQKGIKYPLLRAEQKLKKLIAVEIDKKLCREKQENLSLETIKKVIKMAIETALKLWPELKQW